MANGSASTEDDDDPMPVEPVPSGPVPMEMVLSGRTINEPQLSPDGTTVVFAVRWGTNTGLIRIDLGTESAMPSDRSGDAIEQLISAGTTAQMGRGPFGGTFVWTPGGANIIFVAEDGSLWWQPAGGGAARPLADTGVGRNASGLAISADGRTVVAAIDLAEVWAWRVENIERSPRVVAGVRVDDGSSDFVNDPVVAPDNATIVWQAWSVPDMAWDRAVIVAAPLPTGSTVNSPPGGRGADRANDRAESAMVTSINESPSVLRSSATNGPGSNNRIVAAGPGSIQQPRPLGDGRLVSVRDDSGWLRLSVDGTQLVDEPHEHARATWGSGQHSFAVSPDETRIAFWRNEAGFGSLNIVDLASGATTRIDRGIFEHVGWRGDRIVALRSGARTPPQVVTYDVRAGFRRRIGAVGSVAGWDRDALPEPDVLEVPVGDGADDGIDVLHARCLRAGRGRLMVWVHGGPTDQTLVEWNPRLTYWWSRGYDCLIVDPRGTTGHGRSYQRALNGRWGELDVDDTAAIIADVHRRGWASPSTTVITGGSSGGLTVLGVVGRHPELVCGGIARYPVTDLAGLAEATHRFEAHYTDTLVGPSSDVARLRRLSAGTYAADVERPLLIFHGDRDPVVPLAATVAFVDAVNAHRPSPLAELVVLEGEGHGIKNPIHQRLEYELTEEAMQRWMGGDR